MDFVDKKQKLSELITQYVKDPEKEGELLSYVNELSTDLDFSNKPLFQNIFKELTMYLQDLSSTELKQRSKMINDFMD